MQENTSRGRELIALSSDDLSGFAKRLRQQLIAHHAEQAAPPGHLMLLNMLARAAGHRNLQVLKAHAGSAASEPAPLPGPESKPSPQPAAPTATASTELSATAAKALTQFDTQGRLTRWPHKFSVQRLAMWVLWTRFDGARRYSEREVNEILKAWTLWGDHVTPRRELVEMGLLARKPDCSQYWKQPQRPNEDIRALLRSVRERQA
jgi:hypothetical protein